MSIRLYFDVFLIILILALCCAGLYLWRDKDNALAALAAANTVHIADVATHVADQKTISQVSAYRDANAKVMAVFFGKFAEIEGRFSGLNVSISNLRRTNADVEKYLATPIPPALLCLLGGLCPQTNASAGPAK